MGDVKWCGWCWASMRRALKKRLGLGFWIPQHYTPSSRVNSISVQWLLLPVFCLHVIPSLIAGAWETFLNDDVVDLDEDIEGTPPSPLLDYTTKIFKNHQKSSFGCKFLPLIFRFWTTCWHRGACGINSAKSGSKGNKTCANKYKRKYIFWETWLWSWPWRMCLHRSCHLALRKWRRFDFCCREVLAELKGLSQGVRHICQCAWLPVHIINQYCMQVLLVDIINDENWLGERRKLLRQRAGLSDNEKRKALGQWLGYTVGDQCWIVTWICVLHLNNIPPPADI